MGDDCAAPPFLEAAQYYRFRAPYAPQALAHVCETLGLDHSSRVLDLGCGPGTIAIPLSRRVGHVLAVDYQMRLVMTYTRWRPELVSLPREIGIVSDQLTPQRWC